MSRRTALAPAPGAPTHIRDEHNERRSRCGIKDPVPVVGAAHVQAHIDGHGLVVCDNCVEGGGPR